MALSERNFFYVILIFFHVSKRRSHNVQVILCLMKELRPLTLIPTRLRKKT